MLHKREEISPRWLTIECIGVLTIFWTGHVLINRRLINGLEVWKLFIAPFSGPYWFQIAERTPLKRLLTPWTHPATQAWRSKHWTANIALQAHPILIAKPSPPSHSLTLTERFNWPTNCRFSHFHQLLTRNSSKVHRRLMALGKFPFSLVYFHTLPTLLCPPLFISSISGFFSCSLHLLLVFVFSLAYSLNSQNYE